MILAIILTASRGYLPLAVSADSITASLPSKMALATSLASARVGRRADERYRHHVDIVSQSEFEILFVLFSQRGHADDGSGKIDALVFAENAAVDHFALHVVTLQGSNPQFDQSIRQQNPSTRLH